MGSPCKGRESPDKSLTEKQLNLERSYLVFEHQLDVFCSGQAHQWLSGDLTRENFSANNHLPHLVLFRSKTYKWLNRNKTECKFSRESSSSGHEQYKNK